jgi:hypothetical protein
VAISNLVIPSEATEAMARGTFFEILGRRRHRIPLGALTGRSVAFHWVRSQVVAKPERRNGGAMGHCIITVHRSLQGNFRKVEGAFAPTTHNMAPPLLTGRSSVLMQMRLLSPNLTPDNLPLMDWSSRAVRVEVLSCIARCFHGRRGCPTGAYPLPFASLNRLIKNG